MELFFRRVYQVNNQIQQISLQVNKKNSTLSPNNQVKIKNFGRTILFISGSMSLEGSIACTFFILFICFWLQLLLCLTYQGSLVALSKETAIQISQSKAVASGELSGILSGGVGLWNIERKYPFLHTPRIGEYREEEGELDFILWIEEATLIPFWQGGKIRLVTRSRGNTWSALDRKKLWQEGGEKEVYVTKYGKVYHTDLKCSYLKPEIERVSKKSIGIQRNESGARYSCCKACFSTEKDIVYITKWGTSYHSSPSCRGLKRIIETKKLQEGVDCPCSKCGGK